jgi:GntR family transcriptional regulator/MocR family aminotransferase
VPRSWELTLAVDRDADLPLSHQIARSIADDIQRGRLRSGDRLPGSRRLAANLGVHRNTVLAAMGELAAEGWIETTPGRGTFVTRTLPGPAGRPFSRRLGTRAQVPARAGFALPEPPLAYRPPALPAGTLSLSHGAPDVRLVPVRALGRAYRRALARGGPALLAYGDPEGHPALRSALAAMLASTRGLAVTAEDVVVTRGSQMALSLVARALLRPGDLVAVERLGYRPAWEAFRAAGATLVPVAVDGDGIEVAALEELAGAGGLRAIYVTPHHQYPTTVTLKAARRLALLDLARRHRVAIVEDDYDHELQYEGRPVLPLASADTAGTVVYVGTLSKVLAPALRIGYVAAPPPVLQAVAAIRSLLDIQGDLPTEAAVAALIEEGELQRHVARVRRVYAVRREVLATSLRRTFGNAIELTPASGGMAWWVRLRMAVDLDRWARRSLEQGVSWFPGRRYAFGGERVAGARFSFAWLDEQELPEAVRRLAAALGARRLTAAASSPRAAPAGPGRVAIRRP